MRLHVMTPIAEFVNTFLAITAEFASAADKAMDNLQMKLSPVGTIKRYYLGQHRYINQVKQFNRHQSFTHHFIHLLEELKLHSELPCLYNQYVSI